MSPSTRSSYARATCSTCPGAGGTGWQPLPFLHAVPARDDLCVRLTTARAQLTDNDQGQVVLLAGGEEWTFAPPVHAVLSPLLHGASLPLAYLAETSRLTVEQVAGLITELVNANIATVNEP